MIRHPPRSTLFPSPPLSRSAESRLFRLVSGGEKPAMPMDGTKLSGEQISAIKSWIEQGAPWDNAGAAPSAQAPVTIRSEEHTSELQSQSNLVCRLLLEKKKT